MVAPNGMLEFEIMATSPTNVNTLKKVTSTVAGEIQRLRERESSDSEIVGHLG